MANFSGSNSDLFDLVPGIFPLLDLPLSFIQFTEQASQVSTAGADHAGTKAAKHRRWARGEAAAHKVPNASSSTIQPCYVQYTSHKTDKYSK